jgi:hypothetical protein
MKNIFLTTLILLFISCQEPKYKYIGQEVVDGKVSATKASEQLGRGAELNPKIWIQTPTTTREVSIPFEYEGRWKVGDSCLLIVQKYAEIKEK